MDVHNLLSHDAPRALRPDFGSNNPSLDVHRHHQYPTRQSTGSGQPHLDARQTALLQLSPAMAVAAADLSDTSSSSPTKADPKNITFELLFAQDSRYRARLPMKVQIWRHDNTDNIVSAVKNFFGLYDGAISGVSFEDANGYTLIASYENFTSGMTVYVRVIPDASQSWQNGGLGLTMSASPVTDGKTPYLDEAFQMPPPTATQAFHNGQQISRPNSRLARKQSVSPRLGHGPRSHSVNKSRSRPGIRTREGSFQARLDDIAADPMQGYTSSDGEGASVTSSFKARNEQLASAEISVENIVEGGRRQKAKFESSELPLFVPPQVPAANSISSISPQRRFNGHDNASPFARPPQRAFSWAQPLQSPQQPAYGITGPSTNVTPRPAGAPHSHRLRDRVNAPPSMTHLRGGMLSRGSAYGILPTPDPTIASTISDEDVALQLMRLADPSTLSHGRTSASTMDDAFSGRADLASSATSESEASSDEGFLQQHGLDKVKSATGPTQDTVKRRRPGMGSTHVSDGDESENNDHPSKRMKLHGTNGSRDHTAHPPQAQRKALKLAKARSAGHPKKTKLAYTTHSPNKVPISPASLPPHSRKTSSASLMGPPHLPFADDEDDLSTKPRCQRCRKSKKGCDRQRPCQRCKDAGIGADGCVSEDEGNGRKGRFGRHMGVAVAKEPAALNASFETAEAGAILDEMASLDKNKKRKR